MTEPTSEEQALDNDEDVIDLEDGEETNIVKKTRAQEMRERLRKLKVKNNQARQLNRQVVKHEGERMMDSGKEEKRQALVDKRKRQEEWKLQNSKAIEMAEKADMDAKHLREQASDSLRNAQRRTDRAERNQFGVNDYYNPQGQHRNYERNLKSLPKNNNSTGETTSATTSTFNPLTTTTASSDSNNTRERMGAHRLATEMHRRIEKQAKNKRDRVDFEASDVSYINERNKRFNQKISRNFDKSTADIRQDLERGTAL